MFKGTPEYPDDTLTQIINQKGGNQNAFTSRDFTAYYQNVSKQHVEQMIKLEANRMHRAVFEEDDFNKERKVVIEERRLRIEDNPSRLFSELHRMQAFTLNPNRIPVIGWMDDIVHYSLEDIRSWHQQWYHPNNATLVVVGDVQPEQIHQWAKKYYGLIPAGTLSQRKPRTEPGLSKRIINNLQLSDYPPQTMVSFHTPSLSSVVNRMGYQPSATEMKEIYALIVLEAIFDEGMSSRLYQKMVKNDRSVASVSAYYNALSLNPDLFSFSAVSNGNRNLLEIEAELFAQIERIQQQPPTSAEIQRVLSQVKAAHVYEQDSLFYQGYLLGAVESMGLDWQITNDYLTAIAQVTPEDVQQVAIKFLNPSKAIISRLNQQSSNGSSVDKAANL